MNIGFGVSKLGGNTARDVVYRLTDTRSRTRARRLAPVEVAGERNVVADLVL